MKLSHVSFSYGEQKILEDFSIELPDIGVTAITGPSGCGKTTLLRLLAGLEKPDTGIIEKPGRVSFLFQENRLLPGLTAAGQLMPVLPKGSAETQWLEKVGLEEFGSSGISALSGGMQRRVAMARCMAYAVGKQLIIMDEPFTGIDTECAGRIMEQLRGMKIPVLFSAHDSESLALADRVIRFSGIPLKRE